MLNQVCAIFLGGTQVSFFIGTNPLISLWKVFVRREFLGSTREDDERNWRMDKSTSLGMPPWHPPWTFKNTQASKLGDSQGIPSSSSATIRLSPLKLCFYHFTYYVLFLERHFILLSVCFGFFDGHMLAILCGRETRSAFSLEYSCASLIFCWVFLATVFLISSCASFISF